VLVIMKYRPSVSASVTDAKTRRAARSSAHRSMTVVTRRLPHFAMQLFAFAELSPMPQKILTVVMAEHVVDHLGQQHRLATTRHRQIKPALPPRSTAPAHQ
jgi:hypothetical protein